MDEINQVCMAEIQGITVAVKATVQVAQWIFRLLRWMCKKEVEDRLNMPGCHRFSDIIKLGDGQMPQVLDIPEKYGQQLVRYAQKQGLHLSLLPDLNSNDGKMQFAVPPQESPMFAAFVRSMANKDHQENEKLAHLYVSQEAELKEMLKHVSGEEAKPIQNQLDMIVERNREFGVRASDVEKMIESGGVTDINGWLKTGKNSVFDTNLEEGMAMYEKGMDVSPKYSMQECMAPVRDPDNIPIKKFSFILPDQGVSVTREYKVDKETNLAYSDYTFTTSEGEKCTYSDKNIPKAQWNQDYLPKICEKIGCDSETQARVYRDEKQFNMAVKVKYGEKIIPNVIKKAREKGFDPENFKSAGVGKQIELDKVESLKEKASAEISSPKQVTYRVPVDSFYVENGLVSAFDRETGQQVCLGTPEDIKGLHPVGEDGIGKAWEFSFDGNKPLTCTDRFTGDQYQMSLNEGHEQGKFDFNVAPKVDNKATHEMTEAVHHAAAPHLKK